MDAKKLKLIVKGEKKPTFGTDPNEPWSVRAGITESERGELHAYLKSRGINPEFVSKDTKISHAKSAEFHKWKRDHMFDDPINYVSTTVADRMKKQRAQTEEVEQIEEKNVPTSPEKWARAKAQAKAKFAVYPSAYANGWASKKYKAMGGGWKSVSEESEQLDELAPETLASYVLKTSSKDPNRAEPRKKAMSKLAKTMAKRPADPNAPKYLPMGEEKKPKLTALDKFRKAAAEREKKHSQYEKPTGDLKGAIDRLEKHLNKEEAGISKQKETEFHKKLDTLVHKTFGKRKDELKMKEEVEQIDELNYDTVKSLYKKRRDDFHGDQVGKKKKGKEVSAKNVSRSISRLMGSKPTQNQPQKEEVEQIDELSKKTLDSYVDKAQRIGNQTNKKGELKINARAKGVSRVMHRFYPYKDLPPKPAGLGTKPLYSEESEQIDEISKSSLASYREKSMASLKNAKTNRSAAEPGKDMSKGFADLYAKSNAIAKKRAKGLAGYLQRKHGMKPGYEDQRKTTNEDVFQDTYAATQTPFDMGTQADDREPAYSKRKEMSKSARMIKALYKKHKMVKEEIYDHEKEDKSVATYGKKPKVEKQEVYGDDDTQAAMVLKGGKTLTGQTRDTLEIDPVMRKANKNNDNQT